MYINMYVCMHVCIAKGYDIHGKHAPAKCYDICGKYNNATKHVLPSSSFGRFVEGSAMLQGNLYSHVFYVKTQAIIAYPIPIS